MKNILIVEDDAALAGELKIFLESNGCAADIFKDFEHTVEGILKTSTDIVLLDITLPVLDGQYVLQELRKKSDIPVIMITSRDNELDELISMNHGADDYVTKPFNTHILLAKIDAVLRRSGSGADSLIMQGPGFELDISGGVIRVAGEGAGQETELTKNECRILQFLLKNKGRIVSRDELMGYIWDSDEFVDDNTLTVNVTRLREKLARLGLTDVIMTKRGQGYIVA